MNHLAHWLLYWSGIGNEAGKGYAFWSGIGSCLMYLAVLGAIWHKVNCGVHGCWRVGLRKVPGTEHVVCHRHHPHGRLTHAQVLDDHHRGTRLDPLVVLERKLDAIVDLLSMPSKLQDADGPSSTS